MHSIRYEFEKTGKEPLGAGGVGRLYLDSDLVGEKNIPRTTAFAYSLDETFDVGCDKGSPVTDEYAPLASFVGEIVRIDFDLKPDFVYDRDAHHDAQIRAAMIRQ